MNKTLIAALAGVVVGAGTVALAAPVHDWHDLDKVHDHVVEAINEMNRARAANHYDMAGHGAKAEEYLHGAERELNLAVQAARNNP